VFFNGVYVCWCSPSFEFIWGKCFDVSPLLRAAANFRQAILRSLRQTIWRPMRSFTSCRPKVLFPKRPEPSFWSLPSTISTWVCNLKVKSWPFSHHECKAIRGRLLGRKIIGSVICSFWDCWDLFYSNFIIPTVLDIYPFHDLFACNYDIV